MSSSEDSALAPLPGMGDRTSRVRLAILDDHEVLLDSLSSWIMANAPDFELVLSASTWLQLVHSDKFPTDLVFIDFQLKEPVSIEAGAHLPGGRCEGDRSLEPRQPRIARPCA